MYSDLCDFIEINGLHSITILFNVVSKKETDEWRFVRDSEGVELYRKFEDKKYTAGIKEVDQTRWENWDGYLTDTYYTVHFDNSMLGDQKRLKEILQFLISIKKKYYTPQIYINDLYELDDKAQGLIDYLRLVEKKIN